MKRRNHHPRWVSPATRSMIERLFELRAKGIQDMGIVAQQLGMSKDRLRGHLSRLVGCTIWPCDLPDSLLRIPVRDNSAKPSNAEQAARRASEHASHYADIAERIERDQARIRERQAQHLIEEQRKYSLPRPGRPIWRMPV